MVETRSASSSPVKKSTATKHSKSAKPTAKSTETASFPTSEPLRLVVAPKNLSTAARFLSLPHPIDSKPRRFLFCPQAGLFELTTIDVPKQDPRSILFAPRHDADDGARPQAGAVSNGFVNQSSAYVTATPFDLAFVLLPIVADSSKGNLFQSLDDLLDGADDGYDLKYVAQHSRDLVEASMESICDTVEAGDEKMYRYSQEKAFHLVISKAKRACEHRLPASLEEKFVTRALEAPVLSVKREDSTISLAKSESQDAAGRTDTPTPSDSLDSQSSAASAAPSVVFSEASLASSTTTIATEPGSESSASPEIRSLQRLSTAFKFVCGSYLPPTISKTLQDAIHGATSPVDLQPLTAYLAQLAQLRAEAAASAADISSFTRKRGSLEDEEEAEARAEKRRRLEEEEKRKKASTSRGVKELAKVDTKGMKKMSSFFTKLPAKGKT